MATIRRTLRRGFTLIELMIVVAIIGILAVLAIYGVSKYLKSSKTAEATNNLGALGKNASEAYTREKMAGTFVTPGSSSQLSSCLCQPATATVPAGGTPPAAAKYMSDPVKDWGAGTDDTVGWRCLKFTIDQPQYYMYSYSSDSDCSKTPGANLSATANGDLDGNGTTSEFLLTGQVVSGTVLLAPKPNVTNETE